MQFNYVQALIHHLILQRLGRSGLLVLQHFNPSVYIYCLHQIIVGLLRLRSSMTSWLCRISMRITVSEIDAHIEADSLAITRLYLGRYYTRRE